MQASETKLQPIIEGTKQYIVPLFQRAYSWGKKEWDILWSDLMELYGNPNPRPHFIGSIVTMGTVSVPEGVAKYLLIDGQQRLTTIFILFCVLRDKAKEDGKPEIADEINNTLLVNPYKKDFEHFKLQPTQVDRDSFQKLIKGHIPSLENQIIAAYNYFEKKYRSANIDCTKLKKLLTTNLSVVSVVLDQDDNPYLVFESLNAKGRPLNQSDLIRNYFFMRIHVQEQENVYNQFWKEMEDKLKGSLSEFIRHYLMKNGSIIKQGDIYFSLKDQVGKNDALEYLKDLCKFSRYYEVFLNPDRESDKDFMYWLDRLKRMDVATSYPFFLNCFNDYTSGKLTREELLEVFRIVDNYLIRRFVCNAPTNALAKVFPLLYSQAHTKNPLNFVDGVKKELQGRGYPKDREFLYSLESSKLYGSSERATKTKLILESIEDSFQHKEKIPYNELTIEHVMPQSLDEGWKEKLGPDFEEMHELYLHSLGNLTLTGYNAELSNDIFSDKRIRLIESHLEINKYFRDISDWLPIQMEARGKTLSNLALKIWSYFGEDSAESNTGESATGTTPTELTILGQKFKVRSWRDVLEQTLRTISDLEPEKLDQLIALFPRFVGRDQKAFRSVRELGNGIYIEVNFSANAIQRFCNQAIQSIDLTSEDWIVTTI
jgi:uncharacterized protein with ParB-like and HNH nuclease domain